MTMMVSIMFELLIVKDFFEKKKKKIGKIRRNYHFTDHVEDISFEES